VSSEVVRIINKLNELMYLLVFHAYINEMHGSRSKILSKKSRPYIYDVPQNAGTFLTSCQPVSFSRRTVLYGVSK
jgi:hypothetical protein